LFLFLGLALVKRCAELEEVTLNSDTDVARGRGYHQDDLSVLRSMGIASSFATVLVLALYIDSQSQAALYNSPGWLWGVVPILLFWLMRLWIKATRRQLHGEDPLQFALHDKTSWLVIVAMASLVSLATVGT
jgi:H+/Cl- antiporter ClcA